jgi:hypothetical protein
MPPLLMLNGNRSTWAPSIHTCQSRDFNRSGDNSQAGSSQCDEVGVGPQRLPETERPPRRAKELRRNSLKTYERESDVCGLGSSQAQGAPFGLPSLLNDRIIFCVTCW